MAIDNLNDQRLVSAEMKYFTPPADGSKPWTNINTDESSGERPRNYEYKSFDTRVENIRGQESQYTLDENGFQFFASPSVVKDDDYDNDELVKNKYYTEQAELLKKLTGASEVVVFDHTIRRHQPGVTADTPTNRHPVPYVHVDQTTSSARARVKRHIPSLAPSYLPSETDKPKRFQLINLWRPIRHQAFDHPLALCDYRSVSPGGLVHTTLRYDPNDRSKDGEINSVQHSPGHRWKYVKGMSPEEGVLIKCYDSKEDGSVAVFTPHSSFKDPTTPADAKLRESIELRFLVFYD